MHELAIAVSIIDGAVEELRRRGAKEATAIHVRVGRLSGVDEDALSFSYNLAAQGTVLADSRLVIETVEVAIRCPQCRAERPTRAFPMLICEACGSFAESVTRGDELEITGMEIVA